MSAVYTRVSPDRMAAFLDGYGVGPVEAVAPIPQGIENTNYRVRAGGRDWVVTLYEDAEPAAVAADLALTRALADRGVPVPAPVQGPAGPVGTLEGRPASVVPFVAGEVRLEPDEADLEALGGAVAAFHLAGRGVPAPGPAAHQGPVLVARARELADLLRSDDPDLARLLAAEADHQAGVPEAALPGGVVHGDLFLDNVLFAPARPEVVALLDFHMAGPGPWLFDVAVVLVDGAWTGQGIDGGRARAFLRGYRAVRKLSGDEYRLLPDYLRRACLRFLCLRLERFRVGSRPLRAGAAKDPAEFAERLRRLAAAP